jgi:hypothetical protein
MDIVVVYTIAKLKLTIAPAIERRQLVTAGYIVVPPLKIWFYLMHTDKRPNGDLSRPERRKAISPVSKLKIEKIAKNRPLS